MNRSSRTAAECVCVCAGLYHRRQPPRIVSEPENGPAFCVSRLAAFTRLSVRFISYARIYCGAACCQRGFHLHSSRRRNSNGIPRSGLICLSLSLAVLFFSRRRLIRIRASNLRDLQRSGGRRRRRRQAILHPEANYCQNLLAICKFFSSSFCAVVHGL